ncbi:hypothetical protein [Legionella sp. PC997]|uniref:hypothetical protein n=1 Tax=Legionella sp. PC997 TaxID=2755562 RepID=UPI0015F915CF|nr:hypothetical protein [Legionella sp. PC997]QMT59779.1 hypothetical protein HBNCFIEN_01146 [Legionella sp. PC997]
MFISTILIFLITISLGVWLLMYILKNKNTPKGLALTHGSFAFIGILLLIIYSIFYNAPLVSLLLFIAAAIGGFILIYRDITGKTIPKWLALGHGITALLGLICLILFA